MKKFIDLATSIGSFTSNVEELAKFTETDSNSLQQPLHIICDKQNLVDIVGENVRIKTAKFLLEFGKADINAKDKKNDDTPLHLAVKSAFVELLKFLLKSGSDKKCCNAESQTPIHTALSINSDFAIVKILFDDEVDINMADKYGHSIYYYAIRNLNNSMYGCDEEFINSMKIVKILLKDNNNSVNNFLDARRNTALHVFCENEHARLEVIKYFLECEANININNIDGCTPLLICAKNHNLNMINLLLSYNADEDIASEDGKNILHYAAANKHLPVLKYFIRRGYNINNKSKDGNFTPLFHAVWNNRYSNVKELIGWGANVNERIINNQTVLHVAVELKNDKMVMCLLNNGADISLRDSYGNTPLSILTHQMDKITETNTIVDNTCKKVKFVLLKHIAKLIVTNSSLSGKNLPSVSNLSFDKYFVDCLAELESMRNEKLVENLTFFQILTKPSYKLVPYVQYTNFHVSRFSSDYDKKYPIYSDLINYKILLAIRRSLLIEGAARNFILAVQMSDEKWAGARLPDLILQEILNYLNVTDLENLKAVFT